MLLLLNEPVELRLGSILNHLSMTTPHIFSAFILCLSFSCSWGDSNTRYYYKHKIFNITCFCHEAKAVLESLAGLFCRLTGQVTTVQLNFDWRDKQLLTSIQLHQALSLSCSRVSTVFALEKHKHYYYHLFCAFLLHLSYSCFHVKLITFPGLVIITNIKCLTSPPFSMRWKLSWSLWLVYVTFLLVRRPMSSWTLTGKIISHFHEAPPSSFPLLYS